MMYFQIKICKFVFVETFQWKINDLTSIFYYKYNFSKVTNIDYITSRYNTQKQVKNTQNKTVQFQKLLKYGVTVRVNSEWDPFM